MNGLPCSSLMIEAADSYISFGMTVMVLADATYPATYQYLEGSGLATAYEQMEAPARKANILIAILMEGSSL